MAKILNSKVKNIPWQEKPENCTDPVWRYTENPIIDRSFVKDANSIFNSAVVRRDKENDFAGVFRLDDITREQYLVTGFSDDGIHWKLNDEKIFRGYDPRLCEIDGKYYLSWVCHTDRGTSIGIAVTEDFITWDRKENAVLPVSRNGVLFPRKVNNEYMIFARRPRPPLPKPASGSHSYRFSSLTPISARAAVKGSTISRL